MPINRQDVLCRYHYDPLDRLIGATYASDAGVQRFYCRNRLATEIQGVVQHSIFQHGDKLLAQKKQQRNLVETSLLGTDHARSVLQLAKVSAPEPIRYSPYGYHPAENGLLSLLGFNGERLDAKTGCYLLGNGYRAFNPVLMRFNSPDNYSPFGRGGLNSYAYCSGDPINRYDDTGHFFKYLHRLSNRIFNSKTTKALSHNSPTIKPKKLSAALPGKQKPKVFETLYDTANEFQEYKQRLANYPERTPIISEVTTGEDFARFSDMHGFNTFIFTDSKKLIVAPDRISHGELSGFANTSKVISAGEFTVTQNRTVFIRNTSGHYMPSFESLSHVESYLKDRGFAVKSIRRTDALPTQNRRGQTILK